MKQVLIFWIMLFLAGCTKMPMHEPDKDHVIRGKVIDIRDKKGIAGVEVMVLDHWNDLFNYSMIVTGRDTTAADGSFEVWYTVKQNADRRILKLAHLPEGYQHGITIGTAREGCIYYDSAGLSDPQQIYGGYLVKDEGKYTIELMPLTYVSFSMPVIPASYADRRIELIAYDFCWSGTIGIPNYNCVGCEEWYGDELRFQMNDKKSWQKLMTPFYLRVGNEVRVEYEITHPNYHPIIETFTWEVPYGDTTQVQMVFKE
ncbi:MAG: hypothetical protein JNJ57_17490 [Saprospiraceae bacterium]|nr:hypothetical protein [Saprospiraceae bacterium]